MEPWQQEALHRRMLEEAAKRRPRCQCCDEPITDLWYLDLSCFGLEAVACEACVQANIHMTL